MRIQRRTQTTENNRPRKEMLVTGGGLRGSAGGVGGYRGRELVLAWMLGNNKQKIAASNTQNKREVATAWRAPHSQMGPRHTRYTPPLPLLGVPFALPSATPLATSYIPVLCVVLQFNAHPDRQNAVDGDGDAGNAQPFNFCHCMHACVYACVCVHSNLMMTSIVWQAHGRGSSLPPSLTYCTRPHPQAHCVYATLHKCRNCCAFTSSPASIFLFLFVFGRVAPSVHLLFDSSWVSWQVSLRLRRRPPDWSGNGRFVANTTKRYLKCVGKIE